MGGGDDREPLAQASVEDHHIGENNFDLFRKGLLFSYPSTFSCHYLCDVVSSSFVFCAAINTSLLPFIFSFLLYFSSLHLEPIDF